LCRWGAALSSYLQLALRGKQKIASVIAPSAGAKADRHGHPNALRDKTKIFYGATASRLHLLDVRFTSNSYRALALQRNDAVIRFLAASTACTVYPPKRAPLGLTLLDQASEIVSVYSIGTCCRPTNRCLASARSSDLRILPVSVIGKASTKTTWRGILKLAILLRQQVITSST